MVTYGDMVTLLLALFIMLFAFSSIDSEKFRAIIASFQGAIGVLDSGMTIAVDTGISGADSPRGEILPHSFKELEETLEVLERIEAFQRESELEGAFSIEPTERGVIIHFTDRVLFDTGRAEIKPEAVEILDKVGTELSRLSNFIRVEGHTDNVPIHTPVYPSNWELSAARATSVVRFFIERGHMAPDRLSAAGYGEYWPIAGNETPEGRAKNRRVDIVILRSALRMAEPSATLAPMEAP